METNKDIHIAYLCNRQKGCKGCNDYDEPSEERCKYTTDIEFAKNFKNVGNGYYMEIDNEVSN